MTGRYALRRVRRVHAAIGLTAIAIPATATALAEAAATPPVSGANLGATLTTHKVAYGHDIVVRGHAPSSQAGQIVSLEFAPQSGARHPWRRLSSTRVGGDGHFRLKAWLRRSGLLRVVATGQAQSQPAGTTTTSTSTSTTSTSTTTASAAAAQDIGSVASNPQHVTVTAQLHVRHQAVPVYGNSPAAVRGRLLPGLPGRRVGLQALRGGRWQTVASTRTGRAGRFSLRFAPAGTGTNRLRVVFRGDRVNGPARVGAGSATVYTASLASWYNDGGNTACGFHAQYGVANVSLPCGTKVNFSYGGRTVTAVVDDRGPYAGGRRWDLNQNTAGALGFGGVGTVWSSQ